jgi:hypothetical protein
MPALTRRRSPDAPQETWLVYHGDVRVGSIAIRSGNPADTDPWGWSCGFYPGSHPREHQSGTAATFDQARAGFEAAWRVFLSNRTEADFNGGISATGRHGNMPYGRPANGCRPAQHDAMRLRRDLRQPPARGEPDPRSTSERSP